MEEGAREHDIDLSIQPSEPRRQRRGIIKDIGCDKSTTQTIAVPAEIVARIHQPGLQIKPMYMVGGGAIEDEFADVLTETAAEVEKSLVLFLETGEDFGVDGALGYAGFEE